MGCVAAGTLLPESAYEWGNPENAFLDGLAEGEARIARAAAKSRSARLRARPPVFSGMGVVVHTSEPRRQSFQRLLELGGAQVIYDERPPYSHLPEGATHMVAELRHLKSVSVDYGALAARGVAVVTPVYINEYLIAEEESRPKPDDYLIEPFKEHWKKRLQKNGR